MAISITTPASTHGFIVNGVTTDARGCEVIVAAEVGKRHKIRHITVNSDGSSTVTIGSGVSGAAVEVALIGPVAFSAGTTLQWDFNPPMWLPENKSLSVDASAAVNLCIFCQGLTE